MSRTRAITADTPDPIHASENAALQRQASAGETTASAATLLACSGLVATCYLMGAKWLAQPALGVPTGLWAIAVAFALTRGGLRGARGSVGPWGDALSSSISTSIPGLLAHASDFLQRRAACPDPDGSIVDERAARDWSSETLSGRVLGALAQRIPAQRELRVGVSEHDPIYPNLRAMHILDVVFVPLAAPVAARDALDATLSTAPSGEVVIESREFPGHDAAWYDWSLTPPVSHAAALPLRVDAARCVLGRLSPDDLRAPGLWSHLVRAFAALTRTPARLSVADRFRGRAPDTSLAQAALDDLCAALLDHETPRTHETQRLACRVASAHALTLVGRDPAGAARVCELARTVLASEPAPALRLAAVLFACGSDAAAIDALLHADAVLTGAHALAGPSAPAFLIAELSSGASDAISLARAAAGVAIVCAGRTPDQIGYMRSDTLDELRDHACMVGRDADLALLDRAYRALERQRLASSRGLPPAQAA